MRRVLILLFSMILPFTGCKKQGSGISSHIQFSIGGDLSYVNQILDMGGVYRDSGKPADPYLIFSSYGANTIRFRLFHNPEWTAGVYEPPLDHFYNDIEDTRRGILAAKANGMAVCLDFHYSDTWADPQKQIKPSAWDNLTPEVLADSLYNYTYQTLRKLDASGAMPEYVQVGNEINPGFLLPTGDRWKNTTVFAGLLNSAIRGVRDASVQSATKPKIILHVAQPENAIRWFQGLDSYGITDYDIVGLSYYYIWSTVKIDLLSDYIEAVRKNTGRDVMIVETAYPWTTLNGDSYGNIIEPAKTDQRYPATETGQYEYLVRLVQEVIDGGGTGVHYWEPAWITSPAKDLWGTGSAWDCNTLFDFNGNVLKGMEFMRFPYELK